MQTRIFEIVPQPLTCELPDYRTGREKRTERRKKERQKNKRK